MFHEISFSQWLEEDQTQKFDSMLSNLYPKLKAYFSNRTKPSEVEELTQETLRKAWESINKSEDIENVEAWVMSIAKNVLYDSYRKKTLPTTSIDNGSGLIDDADPSDIVSNTEQQEKLMKIINDMMSNSDEYISRQGKILYMHYIEKMSINDIAQKFNLPTGTIKRTMHVARSRIKNDLE